MEIYLIVRRDVGGKVNHICAQSYTSGRQAEQHCTDYNLLNDVSGTEYSVFKVLLTNRETDESFVIGVPSRVQSRR